MRSFRRPAARIPTGPPARAPRRGTVNGKARAILCAALLATGAHAAPPASIQLPGPARRLVWHQSSTTLAAAMALNGTQFLRIHDNRPAEERWHPRWTSLGAMPAGEGRWLLADRAGLLRLVQRDPSIEDYREVAAWPCDGVPTHTVWHGDRLHVAAGGAGVLVFEWDGESAPYLRARFPFVDFSKEMVFPAPDTMALADNLDTGLQVLRFADIQRPVMHFRESHSFVDGVALGGRHLAISARLRGTMVFDATDPLAPRYRATVPLALGPGDSQARFCAFAPDGALLVCHDGEGARTFRLEDAEAGLELRDERQLLPPGHSVLSAAFLSGGAIALATLDGTLHFVVP